MMIYHEGTGTWIDADDCILVDTSDFPECQDDWDEYMETYGAVVYKIAKGKELL